MKHGLVLVEGQTEERFVNDCLAPYFAEAGLFLTPTIIKTRRLVGAADVKGGVTSYGQVRHDLAMLLHATHVSVITTLLDYYALPDDFPGMHDRPPGLPAQRVVHVEQAWAAIVADRRFIPHLALHEFEAWVYADPACLEPWMFNDDPAIVAGIAAIASAHWSPEDIDEGRATAPSKRLRGLFAAYQKTLHGPIAVTAIGIDRIRRVCPHFAGWVQQIDTLAGTANRAPDA